MSIIAEEKISNLKNFIDSHDNFYIIGHKEPDGDCISSSLGIAEILKKFKKIIIRGLTLTKGMVIWLHVCMVI